MIEAMERLGDRLLSAVLPHTNAAATICWTSKKQVDCLGGCYRVCTRNCCNDGWCSSWSCTGCIFC
jgi:hypothetical protein